MQRLFALAVGAAVALGGGARAHEPKADPVSRSHEPSPIPDRVVLTWTGDPARTQAVTWRTDPTVAKGMAEIAVADGGPLFPKQAQRVAGVSVALDTDLNRARCHTVAFTGLRPKTKYAYRVGAGEHWSEWFHFTTASDRREPFSFIYFGDAQNDIKSMWSRVIREAFSDAPKAAFMLHAGDLINRANSDREWGEWFGAGGWLNGMMPTVPTPGNHEYARDPTNPLKSKLSGHWRPQFALPENGPNGLEETVYFIDYQGTRIVSLNSNERLQEQAAWLDKTLSDNPCRWTVLTWHHPMFSTAFGRDNPIMRLAWKKVIDKHKVDLALTGHDHSYGRTGLVGESNVPTGQSVQDGGTVYVVSVSGPKMYPLQKQALMKRSAEDTQLYQIIHVGADSLRYEARTAVGELYDAFTLRKRPGQPNELLDQTPTTPERLRTPEERAKAAARKTKKAAPAKAGD